MDAARPALPRLVATDLDGTVVRSDDTVSAYTHRVLARVAAAGIPVVGVTGRAPGLLAETRRDLPAADYLVLGGGGQVFDLRDRDRPVTLTDRRLPGPPLLAALAGLEAVAGPLTVVVVGEDGPGASLTADRYPGPEWRFEVATVPRARSLAGDVVKAWVKADGRPDGELLALARAAVPPGVANLGPAPFGYVEMCPPGVDKATGLAVVAEAAGAAPAEVLAFGDMPNDLPMFRWAGWRRVAVANADPEVRVAADEVVASNDQDGVAAWLDRLLTG